MLLVTSELLVLALAMVQAQHGWIDWGYFGLLSLFVQWTVLTSIAMICPLRRAWRNCRWLAQRWPLCSGAGGCLRFQSVCRPGVASRARRTSMA